MADSPQDLWIKQIESIADDLQAGRIGPEEADRKTMELNLEYERESIGRMKLSIAESRTKRGRRGVVLLAILALACAVGWLVLPTG